MALLLCLAVAISAVPAIWTTAARAAESDESEAGADESLAPEIFKWIDEHGVAHYTTDFNRIPGNLRNRAGRLGPPDAALKRRPVDASAPARRTPSAPGVDEGEKWAARDRSFEGPSDTWDEGDPYADALVQELGEDDTFLSEAAQQERKQQLEELDGRIASIQTDIAASEEALKALVAIPVPEGGGPLAMADDPAFREIAGRLPKLLADLRALEDERAQLEAP